MMSQSTSSTPPPSGIEIDSAEAKLCACPSPVRRGRPSVAEAEQLFGRILDAAWSILLQSGFDNFTFDRVARHARIGKATIYSRFAGKRELLHALMLRRIDIRRTELMTVGSDLPLKKAFCVRAARVLAMLQTPEHILLERLIDWFDQESGNDEIGTRAMTYRGAVQAIMDSLSDANSAGMTRVADLEQAARFWLEGLLGHSRMSESEGTTQPEAQEHWAQQFTEFFFAGISALPAPAAQ